MRPHLAAELLDQDAGTPAEIARSLDELWWINRHLGGLASWRGLLARLPAPPTAGAPLSVLDVGAGTGQLTQTLAAELRTRGWAPEAVALDRSELHLHRGLPAVVADAFSLPFATASFDLVMCNLFLHHFHDRPGAALATALLREMFRVARRAVLVNDLERSWWPYLAIQALGPGLSRLTRHDGPASVRQAYTLAELEALAHHVSAGRIEALRLPRYRLGLILWRAADPESECPTWILR